MIMFHVQISRSVHDHLTIFITVLVIALQEYCCAGSLITTPAIDGVLTSCGETQLTCSHDNVAGRSSRWAITRMDSESSLVCRETIDHTIPTPPAESLYTCDEFRFEGVTEFSGAVSDLNSTATVNPLPLDLRRSVVQDQSQLHL